MRRAWRIGRILLLPAIGLAVAVAVAPNRAALEVHIWLLVMLGLALLAFIGLVTAAYPRSRTPFDARLVRKTPSVERPSALARLEREVSMSGSAAFDLHFRLRPTITALAAELLFSRRGIDLDREPERARSVVGPDVWELVRPERPAPTERHGAGIGEAGLDAVVIGLERI
jgi:hypothetical protein